MPSGSATVELSHTVKHRAVKVALLRPPTVIMTGSFSSIGPSPAIGIAYIAGALRQVGHDLQIVDSPGADMEQFEDIEVSSGTIRRIGLTPAQMIDRIRPGTEVIGVTHMFAHEWPTVREIVERARARFPEATIIMGGENATGFWKWMFEQTDAIDAVVIGEGEATVVELVARISAGLPYAGMVGVVTPGRGDQEQRDGGLPVRFRKLDAIPRPAWDLFEMDAYFRYRSFLGIDRGRSMPILATRGCPYQCTFCSSPQMWTTRYTVREPDDVADEVADYVDRYGIKNVDFVDLTPVTKRSWTLGLCDALEARNLDVSLQMPIGTRSEAVDAEVLARLKAAGVTNITFAPETGSPRMLEVYDKRADLDHIMEAIELSASAGIDTSIHMIVGHPEETWKDRWLSWKYMIRASFKGLAFAGGTLYHPYPGSKDFMNLVQSGRLRIDDDYCYDGLARGAAPSQSFNDDLNPVALHRVRLAMVVSVVALTLVLHPSRIVHLVRTWLFGGEEKTQIEGTILTHRRGPLAAAREGFHEVVAAPEAEPEVDAVGAVAS